MCSVKKIGTHDLFVCYKMTKFFLPSCRIVLENFGKFRHNTPGGVSIRADPPRRASLGAPLGARCRASARVCLRVIIVELTRHVDTDDSGECVR